MEKLNQIKKGTVVNSHSSKNITTYTIPVGLHPSDIDALLDIIIDFLDNKCDKTKQSIDNLNKELEYLDGTLNINKP